MTMLSPGEFSRLSLRALEASEGRTRRRKRDQRPDTIGLGVKRDLLERAAAEQPDADHFEAWLFERVFEESAPGSVRAMGQQIFEEYRLAQMAPNFSEWLIEGAPSDDASA